MALAQPLRRLPASLTVYGIEGESFGYGEGLSAPVQVAAAALARDIIVAVSRRFAQRQASP